ncbi:unnamed protein product [Chondrus crispus]|uniref:Uncharacterized protein n=1 Tax=Chondrus crispus TaxID=2769 RepID=R7QN33_CHOCR|nr:unnamed protein product [Chondrus crispus]CDF39917.1 unnamed protein product [Chondrus crispus]|eukprot:XP_005710211.1 unnamed protein product [Chondrus crispus]
MLLRLRVWLLLRRYVRRGGNWNLDVCHGTRCAGT